MKPPSQMVQPHRATGIKINRTKEHRSLCASGLHRNSSKIGTATAVQPPFFSIFYVNPQREFPLKNPNTRVGDRIQRGIFLNTVAEFNIPIMKSSYFNKYIYIYLYTINSPFNTVTDVVLHSKNMRMASIPSVEDLDGHVAHRQVGLAGAWESEKKLDS